MGFIKDLFKGAHIDVTGQYYMTDREGYEILVSLSMENEGLQQVLLESITGNIADGREVFYIPVKFIDQL